MSFDVKIGKINHRGTETRRRKEFDEITRLSRLRKKNF